MRFLLYLSKKLVQISNGVIEEKGRALFPNPLLLRGTCVSLYFWCDCSGMFAKFSATVSAIVTSTTCLFLIEFSSTFLAPILLQKSQKVSAELSLKNRVRK